MFETHKAWQVPIPLFVFDEDASVYFAFRKVVYDYDFILEALVSASDEPGLYRRLTFIISYTQHLLSLIEDFGKSGHLESLRVSLLVPPRNNRDEFWVLPLKSISEGEEEIGSGKQAVRIYTGRDGTTIVDSAFTKKAADVLNQKILYFNDTWSLESSQ